MTPSQDSFKESLLIADLNEPYRLTLEKYLSRRGYSVKTSTSALDALRYADVETFDLIIADIGMRDSNGLDFFKEISRRGRGEDMIVMYPSEEDIEKIFPRNGKRTIQKPFHLHTLATLVEDVLAGRPGRIATPSEVSNVEQIEGRRSKREDQVKQGRAEHATPLHPTLIGNSQVIQGLLSIVDRVAPTNSSVLITGATGTGKELVARTIHSRSLRRKAPFVDINCSAIPDTLVEAELFGHQRGTFTGAHETRRGLFEEASGGTLFLDEVDALNLAAQAKLLRVLQERSVRRVGGRENIPFDVRIISATNRDVHTAVADGSFRSDLLFRLRVVPLHVPELYERGEDIRLLANHFLQRNTEKYNLPRRRFSEEAMQHLLSYRWPGNVRELENTIEYALAISTNEEIEAESLPPEIRSGGAANAADREYLAQTNLPLSEVERLHILSVFKRCGGHQIKTASVLGIDRRTLYRKLQQYGMVDKLRSLFL